MSDLKKRRFRRFENADGHRIIPTKYPPIQLFEDVADADEFDALFKVQAITNPRIQQEIGNINLIPRDEMQLGVPGASYIMAAFTHLNPAGSRFSEGSYGVFYAAESQQTAVAETAYHIGQFLSQSREPAQSLHMRALLAKFSGALTDIRKEKQLHDPDDYSMPQKVGLAVRQNNDDGLYYRSVRRVKGECYAILRPRVIQSVIQTQLLLYAWNGTGIEASRLERVGD